MDYMEYVRESLIVSFPNITEEELRSRMELASHMMNFHKKKREIAKEYLRHVERIN